MNMNAGENKDTPSSYALVPVSFHANNQETATWALLDTGAMANFMDTRLAQMMGFSTGTQGSVLLADGSTLPTSELATPTDLRVGGLDFSLQFATVENLSFPVVLGFPWWHSARCNIDWGNMSVVMHQNGVTTTVSLSNSLSNARKWERVLSVLEPLALPTQKGALPECFAEYAEVFNEEACSQLPKRRSCDLRIDLLPGKTPSWGKVYPTTHAQGIVLKEYIADLVSKGYMRRSNSPCSSPIFFVKKGDGGLRPCVDYSPLNSITIKDRYPVPSAEQLTDKLTGARVFSKLDLRNAYNQVRIAKGHEWKTAVRTQFGLYKYLVMPFGLCNAPSAFQAMINEVLFEYLDVSVVVYLDDILIFSPDLESHKKHVAEVLGKLRDNNLYCKASKCEFFCDEVEFLGYAIKPGGFAIAPSKVEAVTAWPTPTTRSKVRGFLGLANFCRKFIQNFSAIARPLTHLTSENVPFKWTEECQAAFEELKVAFTSAPVLLRPDPSKPFFLETDASDYALGAVLLQEGDGSVLHPVAYFSKKLLDRERNYNIYEKELMAIVKSLQHWRRYTEGALFPIVVRTDHKNLVYFTENRKISQRLARWAVDLTHFDFKIDYKPGHLNDAPDALSRRSDYNDGEDTYQAYNTRAVLQASQFMLNFIGTSSCESNINYLIRQAQQEDPIYKELLGNPGTPSNPHALIVKSGAVYNKGLLVVPQGDIQTLLMQELHDAPSSGHEGYLKTLKRVRQQYWWPHMTVDIKKYVESCQDCQRNKASTQKPHGLLQPLQLATAPWTSISLDFITDLPDSHGHTGILVIVDRFTKAAEFIACSSGMSAEDTAWLLIDHVYRHHGLPKDIVSDRGTQFTSKFWKAIMDQLKVQLNMSTAFHPQTDGQTERVNQVLEQYLRAYVNARQDNWSRLLPMAQFCYNSAYHASTKMTPFYANYGYNPTAVPTATTTTPIPQADFFLQQLSSIHQELTENLNKATKAYKHQADKKRRPTPEIAVGSMVYLESKNLKVRWVGRKLGPRKIGPLKVLEKISPLAYRVELPHGSSAHNVFHVSRLTPERRPPMEHQVKHTKPPPAIDTHTPEWEVEEVIQHRWVRGKIQYLVKWLNYPPESNSWEPKANLKNCKELINAYHTQAQAQKGKEGANVRVPLTYRRSPKAASMSGDASETRIRDLRDAASPHSAIEAFAPMRRKRGRPRKAVIKPPFETAAREASGQGHGGQSAAAAAPEAPAHR